MPRPLALATAALVLFAAPAAAQSSFTSELLDRLTFRSVGPAVTGGRIHDVEAHPSDPSTVFLGTASGGIWKTTNKGTTWRPVFDDQPVSTFGDIAIAPSDPRILFAGTGEQNNRQSTSWGNGVYRSADGGESWRHVGLEGTDHIGAVRIHPTNPEVAWVAALGNLWRPTDERGLYRTTDAGASWERVLYVDTLTGVVDLALDPRNPDILYAAAYQRLRRAWGFNGGGPGSGLYRSTDGGTSWTRLSNGLPAGDMGRIGVAVAPSDPRIVYATIEHADSGGVYRSSNGGESWTRVSTLNQRPMYYSHLVVDPTDPDRVYKLATNFYRSDDGGRTFRRMPTAPTYDVGVHADFHSLWIQPDDPRHLFLGGDGGLYESWDMGETFMRLNTLSIAQIYDLGVDHRDPYHVYIGLQDNHSWVGPSATRHWAGILNDDWRQIGFGDGMYQQVDPTSHRYVYSNSQNGGFTRVDAETGDILNIRPAQPEGETYRWDWTTPSLVSVHDPATVYIGGNRLFVSRDRGLSWETTEDLTRRIDRDTLSIMGVRGSEPMLSKNDGESSFSEIVAIAESPLDAAVLWVGADDGNVQVSRDGGRTWTEVSRNVRGVPDGTFVSRVLASAAGAGVAYATFDAHRDGDWRPYVFRTADFGASWTRITDGLPDGSVNALAEDPGNPNVLYLGTEHALFASADAGRSWVRFRANLPTTLYDDIVIHPRERDLILATHGRGVFILDDARPLAEWSAEIASRPLHVFSIRPATAFHYWKTTSYRGQGAYAGTNPPHGAIVTWHLARATDTAALVVTDADGREVRRMAVEAGAGLHRAVWDLRHEPPPAGGFGGGGFGGEGAEALPQPIGPRGPFVSPGTYTITLVAAGQRASETVQVRADPLLELTVAQHREREEFLVAVLHLQQRLAPIVQHATQLRRTLQAQVESAGEAAAADLRMRADSVAGLATSLATVGRTLNGIASSFNGNAVRPGSMYPPTHTHRQEFDRIVAEVEQVERALSGLAGQ